MTRVQARLRYICAMVLYATIGPILRFVNLPSEAVVLFRGAVGALFVLLFMYAKGMRPDVAAIRANLPALIGSGVALGLNWVFLFAAYLHTTVAIASLCNYMAPIVVIALSPLLYGERLGSKKLACVVAAVTGIALVSDLPGALAGEVNLVGVALGLAAAAAFVLIVIFNKTLHDIGAYDRVVVQLATSACVVLPYVLFENHGIPLPADTRTWLLVALLCLVQTGVAYVFYFGAMGVLPVQEVALLGYIEPVMSVVLSALVLNEPLGFAGVLGAALVLTAAAASELIQE